MFFASTRCFHQEESTYHAAKQQETPLGAPADSFRRSMKTLWPFLALVEKPPGPRNHTSGRLPTSSIWNVQNLMLDICLSFKELLIIMLFCFFLTASLFIFSLNFPHKRLLLHSVTLFSSKTRPGSPLASHYSGRWCKSGFPDRKSHSTKHAMA